MADLGAVAKDAELTMLPCSFATLTVPSLLTKTVYGTVTNDANALTARTVRLYLRSTGALVNEMTSDPTTGAYSLAAPDEEVQRVVLDDDAGTLYNDLLDRVVPGIDHASTGAMSAAPATLAGTAGHP
jgi:hypothetical protein